jgi:hypothetical protein
VRKAEIGLTAAAQTRLPFDKGSANAPYFCEEDFPRTYVSQKNVVVIEVQHRLFLGVSQVIRQRAAERFKRAFGIPVPSDLAVDETDVIAPKHL